MSVTNNLLNREADEFLVRVEGLALDASIGIYPHEKEQRQTIVVDLAWLVAVKSIAQTDDIRDTIDYDEVVSCINTLLANQHFNLLETLVQRMLETLQSSFLFERLKVTVNKPAAIAAAKSVSVTKATGVRSLQAANFSDFFAANVLQA